MGELTEKLYNQNQADMLLGALMKQPGLVTQPEYPLCLSDFKPVPFHEALSWTIAQLAKKGASEINAIDIDDASKANPVYHEIINDNDFVSIIENIKSLTTVENYSLYYSEIRKLSMLREMRDKGVDIREYYDELGDADEERAKLKSYSIQDILNAYDLLGNHLRTKYDVHYTRDEITAGENTQELIDRFKEQPAFGACLQSGYLSTLWNGWSVGHLILRAGASSSGKSRCSVADLCQVGATEMWDEVANDFVENPNYQSPTLFINTEQELRSEVEPMFLASVADVEYRTIISGSMTKEEELRVLKAGEILKKSGLTLCSMPNFTCKSLERKIKERVEADGIKYMCFDYMEIQSDLSAEFKEMSAVAPRQDLVLLNLTSELKRIAEDYSVGILTGCQLRDDWKQAAFVDESYLSGSRAMKNKIDNGSIIVPTTYLKKDMKILDPYFQRRGFGTNQTKLPNICETIFKGRYSIYGDRRLKVWSYFDRGTFRRHDFFITDDDNTIQNDIHPTVIEKPEAKIDLF